MYIYIYIYVEALTKKMIGPEFSEKKKYYNFRYIQEALILNFVVSVNSDTIAYEKKVVKCLYFQFEKMD